MSHGSEADGDRWLRVQLGPQAGVFLDRLEMVTGMNKSTLVNRAVALYGHLWDAGALDPEIGMELYGRYPDGRTVRLNIS